MTTLRQFLVWCNNKDVVPFLSALAKKEAYYVQEGLDVFKTAISSRVLTWDIFSRQNMRMSVLLEKEKALHSTLHNNITGATPSFSTDTVTLGKHYPRGPHWSCSQHKTFRRQCAVLASPNAASANWLLSAVIKKILKYAKSGNIPSTTVNIWVGRRIHVKWLCKPNIMVEKWPWVACAITLIDWRDVEEHHFNFTVVCPMGTTITQLLKDRLTIKWMVKP